MNCNEIRELISCMLDSELSAEDSAIVAEHLAECPECMRVFEAFHTISLSLEEMEEVPDKFTEDVMTRIKQSGTKTTKKKRMPIFRMAGMAAAAACVALVMMAGTHFTSTHMYIGGGNADAAEYVNIKQATPSPASMEAIVGFSAEDTAVNEADSTDGKHTALGEAVTIDESQSITPDRYTATPTMEAVMATPAMEHKDIAQAAVTPAPSVKPQVTPTPIPQMDLLFLTDLLLVAEEAEFELFTEYPAYEITVTDEEGKEITLKIWIDGKRIYCKDEAANTAWYTFGTTEQLALLLGEPAPTPTPAVGPIITTGEVPNTTN